MKQPAALDPHLPARRVLLGVVRRAAEGHVDGCHRAGLLRVGVGDRDKVEDEGDSEKGDIIIQAMKKASVTRGI